MQVAIVAVVTALNHLPLATRLIELSDREMSEQCNLILDPKIDFRDLAMDSGVGLGKESMIQAGGAIGSSK